jgi:hypothetical protein
MGDARVWMPAQRSVCVEGLLRLGGSRAAAHLWLTGLEACTEPAVLGSAAEVPLKM